MEKIEYTDSDLKAVKEYLENNKYNVFAFRVAIATSFAGTSKNLVFANCRHCERSPEAPCSQSHKSFLNYLFETVSWDYEAFAEDFLVDNSVLSSLRDFLYSLGVTYIEKEHNYKNDPLFIEMSKTLKTSKTCQRRLKAGKRKGQPCGKGVYKHEMCWRHDHLKNWYFK